MRGWDSLACLCGECNFGCFDIQLWFSYNVGCVDREVDDVLCVRAISQISYWQPNALRAKREDNEEAHGMMGFGRWNDESKTHLLLVVRG
jgi:hypothetical protein